MKDFFSANQRKTLKLTNKSTHSDYEKANDFVVLITFINTKYGAPIEYTMPATIAYCKRYCAQLKAGEDVTPIKSSEMVFLLR